jgi:hypothetical protein
MTDAVGGYLQQVFKQCNAPANERGNPLGAGGMVFKCPYHAKVINTLLALSMMMLTNVGFCMKKLTARGPF